VVIEASRARVSAVASAVILTLISSVLPAGMVTGLVSVASLASSKLHQVYGAEHRNPSRNG
jgi:hypothetical protein